MPALRISHFECPTHGPFAAPQEQHKRDESLKWWTAPCLHCDQHAPELPNMARLREIKTTGPTTPEGKAKSARNLLGAARTGPRTAEGKKKTAANAWRTGAHATTTPMPPAKPGKYPQCEDCQYAENCALDVEDAQGTNRRVFCHQQADTILRYLAGYLSEDPEHLRATAALNAARIQQTLDTIHKQIATDGVLVDLPIYGVNEELVAYETDGGNTAHVPLKRTVRVGEQKIIHPLLNTQIKILSEIGFRLSDWQMTPRSAKDSTDTSGHFDPVDPHRRDIAAHLEKRNKLLTSMRAAMGAVEEDLANDPILQAHRDGDTMDEDDAES